MSEGVIDCAQIVVEVLQLLQQIKDADYEPDTKTLISVRDQLIDCSVRMHKLQPDKSTSDMWHTVCFQIGAIDTALKIRELADEDTRL